MRNDSRAQTRQDCRFAAQGQVDGGPIPFGYVVKGQELVVSEDEAAIVREAFRFHQQHGQMVLVARELTERELLPRRSSTSKPDEQPFWSKDSIARVLHNPLNAGVVVCGDDQCQGEHEPLVDMEGWQAS
jgi:site-specific DNA recombinase